MLSRLRKLEEEGYTDALRFEEDKLINLTRKKEYSKDDINSCEEFRFEGMTNPSDMSILFALSFKDGNKGTLAAPFGSQGDPALFDFMNQLTDS